MIPLLKWLRRPTREPAPWTVSAAKTDHLVRPGRRLCAFETLESRTLLSAASLASLSEVIATPAVSSGGFTAAQITSAYLANNLSLVTKLKGTITGDGAGQTIAIVDAYNDPNIVSDLATFSTQFGLPTANLKVVSQTGSTTKLPTTSADWALEIALDVEWAHAIAPAASILLVEANSASLSDLLTAVKYAASYTGVSVVSMSWGTDEFSGEASYNSYFTTPTGHTGVTFIASSGDSGVTCWPSVASNVLAVGGTTLTVTSSGTYSSETAWSGSGGGVSKYVSLPSYQKMIGISASGRVTPDVAYDANPTSGFLVYNTVSGSGSTGWVTIGGTSAGAPQWAAILAIVNQGRVANGLGTLTQANATLYTLYATDTTSDFHDVTSGSNTGRYAAAKGYDAVTGLGSPIVKSLVADLATATATSTTTSTTTITIAQVGSSGGGSSGGWGGGGWRGWGGSRSNGPGRGGYGGYRMTALTADEASDAYADSSVFSASQFTDPSAGLAVTMSDLDQQLTAASHDSSTRPSRMDPESQQADAAAEQSLPTIEDALDEVFFGLPAAQPRSTLLASSPLNSQAVDQVFGSPLPATLA
jgi:hypothetical protein